jgi:molybdenum-dependent DNA-binding transcriptional regulator ModE
MDAIERHSAAGAVGATISGVTTREKAHRLLDELPESEVEPVVEFIASRRGRDADLEALVEEEGDELLAELDAREEEIARRRSEA